MKHRSIIKMFLLFIVTLGIYRLYWLVKTRSEMVKKDQQIPSVWIYIGIYSIVYISFIGLIYSYLTSSQSICHKAQDIGTNIYCPPSDGEILFTVLFYVSVIFILPLVGLWYWKYAKAVDEVTKGKMSFALGMIILLAVPDGFDMLIIQDSFNKLPEPK